MQIKNQTIKEKPTFKAGGIYNLTAQIQENTILNRGLIDLGGLAIPQMIMSNNKDERVERGIVQGLYFATSFLAPFVMLPFFNKTFLAKNVIVKEFKNNERKIIEVSKKYLTKDTDLMIDGIRQLGKKLNCEQDFENVLNRFQNKDELKNKLLKTHEQVLFSDFLSTSLMWCATPWIATEITKLRTKRSGFSATYGMASEEQTKKNAENNQKQKTKNLITSALIGTIPSVLFAKLITKGLKTNVAPLLESKNIFKKMGGKILSTIKKHPTSFDYAKGIYPSKAIFASIWLLCDYPSSIISARDNYEKRDRAIRGAGTLTVFFGGDFVLNNIFGRLSDKFLKTKIMDNSKITEKSSFFRKMLMTPKSFAEIKELKDVTPQILKRTKNIGAGLYWLTLVANMGILGFGLPAILNKMLKKTLQKELNEDNKPKTNFEIEEKRQVFEKLKLTY